MKANLDIAATKIVLLDTRTLAEILDCSTRHIERLDASGKMPAPIRLGRSKKWRTAEIANWLNAGCPSRRAWDKSQGGDHA